MSNQSDFKNVVLYALLTSVASLHSDTFGVHHSNRGGSEFCSKQWFPALVPQSAFTVHLHLRIYVKLHPEMMY